MKISQKLIILFLLMALIPILAIGAFSYFNTQRALNEQISVELSNTLTRQADKVDASIQQDITKVGLLDSSGSVRIFAADYHGKHSAAPARELSGELVALQALDRSMRRISVADTDGVIYSSSDARLVGRDYSRTKVFQTGLKDTDVSLFTKDLDGIPAQYLTAPILTNGQTVGVVIVEHTTDAYRFITSDYVDVGQTGETFILAPNQDGQMVSPLPLRFDLAGGLKPYRTSGSGTGTRDYRDHLVLQTSKQAINTQWTVAVKMDQSEVYAPVTQLRDLTLGIIAVTTLLVFFVGWYFSHYITAPIKRFTDVVMRIRAGDLKQRVRIESKDEIGILGTAFNEMTSNLLESRTRLIASVLSLTQGFIMTDRGGKVITINGAGRRLLDVPRQTADEQTTLKSLFHNAKDVDVIRRVEDCFKQQVPSEVRDVPFGAKFYTLFFSPVSIDGQAIGVVVLVSDETEQKMLQRSRDEFFSIASHELRTPLTAIMGNVSLIKTIYTEQLKDADLKQMMDDIDYSSKRLIAIVNDFLDMSSLELGKVTYTNHPIDLVKIASDLAAEQERAGILHGLTLTVQKPPHPLPLVSADVDRVKQVFSNLLSNSTKSTEKGGITISFKLEGGKVETSIADTGKGITEENQKLLFRKFQQAADSILTRDTAKGTGLGLYITKLIVEGMGGHVGLVRSEVGKGTTFAFALKVATAAEIGANERHGLATLPPAPGGVGAPPSAPGATVTAPGAAATQAAAPEAAEAPEKPAATTATAAQPPALPAVPHPKPEGAKPAAPKTP